MSQPLKITRWRLSSMKTPTCHSSDSKNKEFAWNVHCYWYLISLDCAVCNTVLPAKAFNQNLPSLSSSYDCADFDFMLDSLNTTTLDMIVVIVNLHQDPHLNHQIFLLTQNCIVHSHSQHLDLSFSSSSSIFWKPTTANGMFKITKYPQTSIFYLKLQTTLTSLYA